MGKTDECQELKNLKYKTMLLNGNNIEETAETCTFDDFLKNKKEMIKAVIEPVIIDNETVKPDEKKTDKKKRKKSKPTRVIYYGSDTESSEDERILYLPKSRARKPQPRVRTQFFEDEEPDYYSDEADDTANYNASYDQPPPPAETYYTQKFV